MERKKYIPHEWETVSCPFCDSYKNKLHERFGCDLQFTYVKCEKCGLIYQSPRPKYDEVFLKAAYGEYFTYDEGYEYSEANLLQWDKELKEILRFDKKRTAILDIGSCMGDFLKAAQKYYPICYGIEVSENMAKFTEKKLNTRIFSGDYTDFNPSEKFSCIHMSHVIEHIPNPKDWLSKSKEILDENGILVISVPNMLSMSRRFKLSLKRLGLVKGKWKENWRTPDHLFEPTIKSTIKFLNENGFDILEYYTYSRKDPDVSTLSGKILNRKLKTGSNLRFFVTLRK
ncbi:MAG: class I SAM-dependent methyltransferase [Bacteroidales bacterium]|jgi:2-polyprenyl-3-methyl-5-hydroxy-6-metoxy-1,4-benzoquinol methylase|nr:class I SAM-dependent methyltransferase [Bacteroidales bacterium]